MKFTRYDTIFTSFSDLYIPPLGNFVEGYDLDYFFHGSNKPKKPPCYMVSIPHLLPYH